MTIRFFKDKELTETSMGKEMLENISDSPSSNQYYVPTPSAPIYDDVGPHGVPYCQADDDTEDHEQEQN